MAAACISISISISAAATPQKQKQKQKQKQWGNAIPKFLQISRPLRKVKVHVSSSSKGEGAGAGAGTGTGTGTGTGKRNEETIFFDGGAHYGDLVANLVLGFTLVWLPLTLAAVFRAFFLRYRFTDVRVTVISGQERSDFSYDVVKDVQVVPRFIGEWGDVIITLKDGTKVDLRSVPKFRDIAKYCLAMADKYNPLILNQTTASASASPSKGF